MNTKQSLVLALLGCSIFSAQLSTAFAQGSLMPPGPPGPTMLTLSQIEPRTPISSLPYAITNSGSYYLTTNLTNAEGDGIYVTANNVNIDLKGFTLDGGGSANGGIVLGNFPNQVENISIHDGQMGNWGNGVMAFAYDVHLERLQTYGDGTGSAVYVPNYGFITYGAFTIDDCIDFGAGGYIFLGALSCSIQNCTVYGSGGIRAIQGSAVVSHCDTFGAGIQVGSVSTVVDCTTAMTESDGIIAGNTCTISGCTVFYAPANGISMGNNCVVKDCTTSFNFGGGLIGGNGCKVTACTAGFNTCSNALAGIVLQNNSSIDDCTVETNNGSGIVVGLNCVVKDSVASGNGTNGISTGNGCTIGGCSSTFNTNNGIIAASECTISGCTVSGNNGDGIQAGYSCIIKDNTAASNSRYVQTGGAGIHVLNNGNRIEGNNLNSDYYGIKADGAENFITRNTVRDGISNYSIVTGNMVGTIVSATSSGAIVGATGGSGMGSTDPWANFSY